MGLRVGVREAQKGNRKLADQDGQVRRPLGAVREIKAPPR